MKVELLYFGGCPGYEKARHALEEALVREGIWPDIKMIAVDTLQAAHEYEFPGSPTIRIDGRDIFPLEALNSKPTWHLGGYRIHEERPRWGLRCRFYETPEGRKDHPTTEMLQERLVASIH
jgi:hypothetical protein